MTSELQGKAWSAKKSLSLAGICLAIGIAFGYVAHGPNRSDVVPAVVPQQDQASQAMQQVPPPVDETTVTPEQMKQASTKAAAGVLDKLKDDPKNFKLLVAAGDMYYHHGAIAQAGDYYRRALEVEDNVAVRNQYASMLFYGGDADGALKQYEAVLGRNPKNDVALFNEGMIKLKAKNDREGAVASWKRLLAAYPKHPHRDQVQKLIERASSAS